VKVFTFTVVFCDDFRPAKLQRICAEHQVTTTPQSTSGSAV
jgi:hypothetical protein